MAERKEKVVWDLSIPEAPTLPPLDLPARAEWIPEQVYDCLRQPSPPVPERVIKDPGVEGLRETARTLVTSPAMQTYWGGDAGKALQREPAQVWRLADCAEIARTEGRWSGAFGGDRFAAMARWLLRPRAEREKHAHRVAKRARELRDDLEATPFDLSAYLAMVLGKVERAPDEKARADGPQLTRILDGLASYAEREAVHSRELPVFNDTWDRLPRFVMALVYRFHTSALGLSKTGAQRAAAEIASALFPDRSFDRDDAYNATRRL